MKPTSPRLWLCSTMLLLGVCLARTEPSLGVDIQVELDAALDQFGSQIETVQVYEDASGVRATFGIYDTGCSVVSVSAQDQAFHVSFPEYAGPPIPIKVPGGAEAVGIGGTLIGDVSQPGRILAAGIDAVKFDDQFNMWFDDVNVPFVDVPGVQLFVGTYGGSPHLPTITGTPIHNGRLSSNPDGPNGVAALVDMQWAEFDLGALFPEFGELFQGILLQMPNVRFVTPGSPEAVLTVPDDDSVTTPVRVSMSLYGEDNHENPGDIITASYNPFQNTGVVLSHEGLRVGDNPNARKAFLFDTGAQLSIISNQMALDLGLDLDSPQTTIEVQGAAGGVGSIPGFTIDSLELPVDDDGDGTQDGTIQFTNVPVFVLDVTPDELDPEEGLDGILGMNLFNTASEMLYDPYDPLGPSLRLTFLTDPYREDLDDEVLNELQMLIADLQGINPFMCPAFAGILAGSNLPHFRVESALIPGDANRDGVVNDIDASILAMHWQAAGVGWAEGDFNGDGLVTDIDASILAVHWQEGTNEGGTPVPEPTAATLLALGGLLLLLLRRRHT